MRQLQAARQQEQQELPPVPGPPSPIVRPSSPVPRPLSPVVQAPSALPSQRVIFVDSGEPAHLGRETEDAATQTDDLSPGSSRSLSLRLNPAPAFEVHEDAVVGRPGPSSGVDTTSSERPGVVINCSSKLPEARQLRQALVRFLEANGLALSRPLSKASIPRLTFDFSSPLAEEQPREEGMETSEEPQEQNDTLEIEVDPEDELLKTPEP